MGLDTTFTIPKRTKKQQVLDKHGYFEKVYFADNGKMIHFIVPNRNSLLNVMADINEGIDGPVHYTGSIVLGENENWNDFFVRLGWADEEGNIM